MALSLGVLNMQNPKASASPDSCGKPWLGSSWCCAMVCRLRAALNNTPGSALDAFYLNQVRWWAAGAASMVCACGVRGANAVGLGTLRSI